MSEADLHNLSIRDLSELMLSSLYELSMITKDPEGVSDAKSKREEIFLIQKVLTAKRSEFPPGK